MSKNDPIRDASDEGSAPSQHEILQVFKRGAEFTEQLLKENERLRFHIAELEGRAGGGSQASGADTALSRELMEKVQRLEREKDEVLSRFSRVEAENRDFADRYVQIEAENNNLLNIYVASYQLHSTMDFQEVLHAITEVVLNFIGAEVFLVAMVDEKTQALVPLVGEGIDEARLPTVRLARDVLEKVVASGTPHFVDSIENLEVELERPAICVPLKIKDQVIGVVAIYKFLQQKKRLDSVDHELFTLLAGHAATALFAAKLYTDSKRKLSTIQGFLELVTSAKG